MCPQFVLSYFELRNLEHHTLLEFYRLIKPAPVGWRPVIDRALQENTLRRADIVPGRLPLEIAAMLVGCLTVYASLFSTGFWIYGNTFAAWVATVVAVAVFLVLGGIWRKLR